ncbi:MAG: phosphate permease, partial [Sedimenticola sp.]
IAVGAVMGVGLARGVGAIDLRVIGNIVVSWVITLPAGGILAAAFFFLFKGIFG